jgi:DNA-binding CsgD family transcriptional regulator
MVDLSRQARDAGLESTGVTNYRITADVAIRLMDYPTARVGTAEGMKYADEVQQSYCRHVMSATSACLAWTEGRWDDAVLTGESELVERGSRRGTLGSRAALAFVAFGRGDVERAKSLLDEALAISRPSGEIDLVLPALWGLAETALIAGDPRRAFDHCQEAIELASPTAERAFLVPFVVTGVRAALADRRPEAAERWLDRARKMLAAWPDLARPALDHADGLLRLAAGSIVAARASLESAIDGWDAKDRIWESTWARVDLATCLVRSNRYGEAVRLLDDVQATADRLGAEPIRARVDELTKLARSRGGEVEPWHPLSAREFEVARKIAEGRTNAQLAEELGISPKTGNSHVEHILTKLGVARRAEIAAWASGVAASPAPPTAGQESVWARRGS